MSEQPTPQTSSSSATNPGGSPAGPPENSGHAIVSLVLGILSLTCFGFLSGIPAIILGKGATRKIRESAGSLTGSGLAQAGIITGWIGTILSLGGIAVFLALQLFTARITTERKQAQLVTCINNLRQIDAAKQQWALDNKVDPRELPTWENIHRYLGRGTSGSLPECPSGGTYIINDLQTNPQCTVPGHSID